MAQLDSLTWMQLQATLEIDGYRVLAQEHGFVVVEKTSGLLSVPGIGAEKADCLVARVALRFPTARIVHRLDRDTSGVMVLALDAHTHRRLSMAFEARKVQKTYHALVASHPQQSSGLIDLPLRKEALGSAKQIVCLEHGRASQTRWHVQARLPAVPISLRGEGDAAESPKSPRSSASTALLASNSLQNACHAAFENFPCTCVQLEPLTGRSHQLRVHMLMMGHPILGDDLYASPEAAHAANRLCLHATSLRFEGFVFEAKHPALSMTSA